METKQVMMHNVSSLPLTVVLQATYPFQLLVEDPRWAPVNVKSSQSVSLSAENRSQIDKTLRWQYRVRCCFVFLISTLFYHTAFLDPGV